MKKIVFLLLTFIAFYSCEKNEMKTFDNVNGQTLAFFESNSSSLPVVIDQTGSLELNIGVTTISNASRTVSFSLNEEETTADSENYTISATSVTIPAGEYWGSFTISGVDVSVETEAKIIALDLTSVDNGIVNTTTHKVSLFQVCPIEETSFVGAYLIEQTTPYVDGPTLQDGDVVIVTAEGTRRSFETSRYVDYCSTPMPFVFDLVCNETVVPNQNTNCSCGNTTDWFGPAEINGTYDPNDDTVFDVTFSDDQQVDCGPTAQTSYRFTKQ